MRYSLGLRDLDMSNLQKINFIPPLHPPPSFSGDIAKICNFLFWVFWACLVPHPKWQNQLVDDFNVHLLPNNKLHHWLLFWDIAFWRILQFDWLRAFWSITEDPVFCQIGDWLWNINNNISFHLASFARKSNAKLFQKIQINLFLAPFWSKSGFSSKKGLCNFLDIPIIYHRAKNQKKLSSH